MAPNSNPLKLSTQKIKRPKNLPVKIFGYTVRVENSYVYGIIKLQQYQ